MKLLISDSALFEGGLPLLCVGVFIAMVVGVVVIKEGKVRTRNNKYKSRSL